MAPVPFLLVDRVGVLAALYGAAGMAYVGGGFGRAGLHSVLEPAACGIPVVFGPRWQNSRDAGLLLAAGGAESLSEFGTEEAGEALHALWRGWLDNETRRPDPGSDGARGGRTGTRGGRGVGGAGRGGGAAPYLTTIPSAVTVRGTTMPAVSTVTSTSDQRLRTLILTSTRLPADELTGERLVQRRAADRSDPPQR